MIDENVLLKTPGFSFSASALSAVSALSKVCRMCSITTVPGQEYGLKRPACDIVFLRKSWVNSTPSVGAAAHISAYGYFTREREREAHLVGGLVLELLLLLGGELHLVVLEDLSVVLACQTDNNKRNKQGRQS